MQCLFVTFYIYAPLKNDVKTVRELSDRWCQANLRSKQSLNSKTIYDTITRVV